MYPSHPAPILQDRLDRAAIGEYLGEGDPRCIEVMHRYVDLTEFDKTPEFLKALRHFLVSC